MPRGAALSEGSGGDNVSHFTAIRFSMKGVGNLLVTVYSMNDVRNQVLVPIPLFSAREHPQTRLCNFTTARASFELKTTEIDEVMHVNRITIYSKEVATSVPG